MRTKLAFVLAAAMGIGSTQLATAADMPTKAPMAPAQAAFSWTGFYVGAGAGWARGNFDWRYQNPVPATIPPFSANNDNWAVGGFIGYQYQWSQVVLGVEASGNWLSGNDWASGQILSFPTANQVRADAIYTVGGKLGWAWNTWLLYADGGWASGRVETQLVPTGGSAFDVTSQRQNGWYAGGGVDYLLAHGAFADFIVGLDYKHVDLGTHSHLSSLDGFAPSPPGINGRDIGAKEDIVTLRLTVKVNPSH